MSTDDATELTLGPSRIRLAVFAFFAAVFFLASVAAGVALVVRGEGSLGLFVLVIPIALGMLALLGVAVAQLLPGGAYLRLTQDTLEMRYLFRSWSRRWDDVDHFRATDWLQGPELVRFDVATPHGPRTVVLPDTYRMKAADLVTLLEEWRARSGTVR